MGRLINKNTVFKKLHVEFHFHETEWSHFSSKQITQWIQFIAQTSEKPPGNLSYVFCTDEYLLKMNQEFLQHNYYTDIITFPLHDQKLEAELYISLDRVKDNAKTLAIDPEDELLRVIIHGVFHLMGYGDKTKKQQAQMRSLEDEAIQKYKQLYLQQSTYYDLVYDVVRMIPRGKICTYGLIADFLHLGSARMVGYALNHLKNGAHDIPAHRVVNAKGELSGRHAFQGPKTMETLLKKEGVEVEDDKVTNYKQYLWIPKE